MQKIHPFTVYRNCHLEVSAQYVYCFQNNFAEYDGETERTDQ